MPCILEHRLQNCKVLAVGAQTLCHGRFVLAAAGVSRSAGGRSGSFAAPHLRYPLSHASPRAPSPAADTTARRAPANRHRDGRECPEIGGYPLPTYRDSLEREHWFPRDAVLRSRVTSCSPCPRRRILR